jgi:hypothetical protein
MHGNESSEPMWLHMTYPTSSLAKNHFSYDQLSPRSRTIQLRVGSRRVRNQPFRCKPIPRPTSDGNQTCYDRRANGGRKGDLQIRLQALSRDEKGLHQRRRSTPRNERLDRLSPDMLSSSEDNKRMVRSS